GGPPARIVRQGAALPTPRGDRSDPSLFEHADGGARGASEPPPLRPEVYGLRSGQLSTAAPLLEMLVDPARRAQTGSAWSRVHVHEGPPGSQSGSADRDGGGRSRGRGAFLRSADRLRSRNGDVRDAGRADLPPNPRGRRLRELLLEVPAPVGGSAAPDGR